MAQKSESIELLLSGGIVVTMDAQRRTFEPGALAIDQGRIVAVGPAKDLGQRFQALETLDCSGMAVIPGLINGHTHAPMSLLRGLRDDLQLDVWLFGYILPVETRFVDEDFCRLGTLLSCAEMIRGGTTTFADMYYYEDAIASVVDQVGLRAVCAETIMRLPTPDAQNCDESLAYTRSFIERWRDHPRVIPALGPHAPYTVTTEILSEVQQIAQQYQVPILIHLAETAHEVEESLEGLGLSPTSWLHAQEFFEGAAVTAAHCVHVDEGDIAILQRKGVGIVSNPTSNLKLASGIPPYPALIEAGLRVGLGTDGCASNNDLNMFEEMRLAAFLAKAESGDPTCLPAQKALAMATIEGAQALHLEARIGSLEAGKRADVVVVDLRQPHHVPRYRIAEDNVYSQLVYTCGAADVYHVMVEGRLLLREQNFTSLDVAQISAEAQRMADRIGSFVMEREVNLLDKILAIGGIEQQETFEVQVKARVPDFVTLEQLLVLPQISHRRRSERIQYDTYFFFQDERQGRIRYREDNVLDERGHTHPSYNLTLILPAYREEYPNAAILSRSRFTATADRSLRFYREYFQPDQVQEVEKHRERVHISYEGQHFALNMDTLKVPQPGHFLEIKSRTWSRSDAENKVRLIGELLALFNIAPDDLVKGEYVEF
ncbi:MAG: amidohydrolase family protein [Chloroflexia bacterium]|nr:amidohydrolase family protein [Chloroflexia bacterium]